MNDKVLVDTSAWIDFFRKKDPTRHGFVASLLRQGYAAATGIICLELLRGAKTSKELTFLTDLFETIEMVNTSHATYIDAGKMGYELARNGYTLGVVDLMIAQLAIENGLALFTLDEHFTIIARSFPVKLIEGGTSIKL